MNCNMKISIKTIQLVDPSGFDKAFTALLQDPKIATHEQAYNILEEKYKQAFGKNKYSNYDSYRKARNRRLGRN